MNLKSLILLLAIASLSCGTAEARRRSYSSFRSVPSGHSNKTAQDVAECQAHLGVCAHFGGNAGYEGCGCAHTPEAALRSCCYSNSGMPVVDQGVALSKNGMYYACKRYGYRSK